MARSEDETRQLFNTWAASYDADLSDAPGPLAGYAHSLKLMDVALSVTAGMHLLDIGVGTGAVAALFAERGARITGVDPSEKMLARCRDNHPDFELQTGTFNNVPAADATYDGIVSGFAWHETPLARRDAACAEMARAVKPGGVLCLLDIMFASAAATAQTKASLERMWDDSEDYAMVGELDTRLRQSGFVDIWWLQTAPCHWLVRARRA